MKTLNKCIAGALVLSIIGLYFPRASFCAGSGLFAKTDNKTITRHKPRIMSAPEQDIPTEKAKKGEEKGPNWLYVGLGAVLVLGLAAVGGGGGGGDDDENGGTGTITLGW